MATLEKAWQQHLARIERVDRESEEEKERFERRQAALDERFEREKAEWEAEAARRQADGPHPEIHAGTCGGQEAPWRYSQGRGIRRRNGGSPPAGFEPMEW